MRHSYVVRMKSASSTLKPAWLSYDGFIHMAISGTNVCKHKHTIRGSEIDGLAPADTHSCIIGSPGIVDEKRYELVPEIAAARRPGSAG